MRILLNVGAGENWLTRARLAAASPHLRDFTIFNLDIYESGKVGTLPAFTTISMGNKHRSLSRQFLENNPNVEHGDAVSLLDFADDTADALLSVSPYGFAPLNPETMRLIKPYGYFVLIGNSHNKYVANDASAISTDAARLLSRFSELRQPMIGAGQLYGDTWVNALVKYVLRSYVSKTTHAERTTNLDCMRVWRRIA